MTDAPISAQPVSPHVAPPPRAASGDIATGIALMIAFCIVAPGIDVFAKLATQILPSAEVAAARFIVQFAILLPIMLWRGSFSGLTRRSLGVHALRGLLLAVATVCFVTALREMPVADAIAIFFVEPMFLTVMGGLLLGEKVGWRRYAASLLGFIGALIVVRPSFQELGYVALLPLGTAFTFTFYLLLTRYQAQREDPIAMQGFAGWFGAILIVVVLWAGEGSGSPVFDPQWPTARGWVLSIGVGVMATISHLVLTYAFRKAPASVLAPLQYFEIATATILGFLVFGDFPDALKWLGIAIIVGSGLFIFWRERVVAAREAAEG